MIEFVAFFVLPFDENMPAKETEAAIERAKQVRADMENRCMEEYLGLAPEQPKKLDRRVWAQSRIDFEMRVIGVSLRLPVEKAAGKDVVAAVRFDDFLYWDLDELTAEMVAMRDAVGKVAAEHNAVAHTAFSDVKYRL